METVRRHNLEAGLRALAIFEASKGVLVLAAGLGLLSFIHRHGAHAAQELVSHLHLNPAKHYPQILRDLMADATDARLWILAGCACAYSAARFVEGYGLWRGRRWAEWFGVASGAIYLPAEIYGLLHGITAFKAALVGLNAGVVLYLARTLRRTSDHKETVPHV